MTPAERWEQATPHEMLELSLHAERGPMVVDDLRELPVSPLIVAEGSTLSPSVVSSGIADPSRAVWLAPTADAWRDGDRSIQCAVSDPQATRRTGSLKGSNQ